jgi:hypothetical protein
MSDSPEHSAALTRLNEAVLEATEQLTVALLSWRQERAVQGLSPLPSLERLAEQFPPA